MNLWNAIREGGADGEKLLARVTDFEIEQPLYRRGDAVAVRVRRTNGKWFAVMIGPSEEWPTDELRLRFGAAMQELTN